MNFAIDLIQKIPAGWPRLATLAAIIAAYFFFPDIVKKLRGSQKEKEPLERLTQFLQVKKLLFELEVFQKEKNLSGFEFPGEARLLSDLTEAATAVTESKGKIPYVSRLKSSLLASQRMQNLLFRLHALLKAPLCRPRICFSVAE